MNLQSTLLKIKNYITISRSINALNTLLMLFLIWSAGLVGARVVENEVLQVPPRTASFAPETDNKHDKSLYFEDFKPIIEQNIFGAEVTSKKESVETDLSEAAITDQLDDVLKKLRLTGVLYSRKAGKFCIIKEKSSRKEDIFTINDEVFNTKLLITKIIANLNKPQVYLKMDDKMGILEYEEKDLASLIGAQKAKPSPAKPVSNKYTRNGKDFRIPKGELDAHLQDFSRLLTQAKMSPYFKRGKNIGYQFRSIKRGSIFEKLGMQNKDIITKVNGEGLEGAKFMELYRLLKHEKEFSVEVERGGQTMVLNYNIY